VIVLDTNVVSELIRPQADAAVVAWVDQQPVDDFYLTAVTTAELRYGIARLPSGRRRTELADRVGRMIEDEFPGRILPFDDDAAQHYAQVAADRENRGQPIGMADAQIAAICRSYRAQLATRNTKDFAHTGVVALNPWTAPG
jgi:hypothetical protein